MYARGASAPGEWSSKSREAMIRAQWKHFAGSEQIYRGICGALELCRVWGGVEKKL